MVRVLIFVLGLIVGLAAGAGGMLVAFPFLFPPPVVAEAAPATGTGDSGAELAGTFEFDDMAPGRDAIHWADGTGGIYRDGPMTVLRFDDTFATGPGPAYWVYLNTVAVGEEDDFLADAGRVRVMPLKSFTGGQNYVLAPDLRIEDFHTVTIWCEAFGAYIGSAPLPQS